MNECHRIVDINTIPVDYLSVTGMQGCNPNHVPATQVALGSDPDGDPMHEIWSYSSDIGMMLYLLTNICSDITFAVSQVARFFFFSSKAESCFCCEDHCLVSSCYKRSGHYHVTNR